MDSAGVQGKRARQSRQPLAVGLWALEAGRDQDAGESGNVDNRRPARSRIPKGTNRVWDTSGSVARGYGRKRATGIVAITSSGRLSPPDRFNQPGESITLSQPESLAGVSH